jgi:hypothetical protein
MTNETLVEQSPKCAAIAEAGITNSQQTIAYLSALIADASAGRVTTGLVHGTCNAIGKMLRVVEMEVRYGTVGGGANGEKCLSFVQGGHAEPKPAPVSREQALAKLSPEERAALGL